MFCFYWQHRDEFRRQREECETEEQAKQVMSELRRFGHIIKTGIFEIASNHDASIRR